MKILILNGSPHASGSTYTALAEIEKTLKALSADTELIQLGTAPVRGCIGCGGCRKADGCVFDDDIANLLIEKLAGADGFIVGSPVYFSSSNGSLTALLDRVFCAGSRKFAHKPAAAVVVARRGGTSATLDQLNKYFTISQMPVVPSTYWNMVHGASGADVLLDAEGLQTIRNLAANMVWLISCIEAGKGSGIMPPIAERGAATNFINPPSVK